MRGKDIRNTDVLNGYLELVQEDCRFLCQKALL